jgi:hypothetical protein
MVIAPLALKDLASVIRSKNAGPLCLTVDLFFRDRAGFDRALASAALMPAEVARLYGLTPAQVRRFDLPDILAIKLSMPRQVCAGDPGDGDVYGAQQHAPLLEVPV